MECLYLTLQKHDFLCFGFFQILLSFYLDEIVFILKLHLVYFREIVMVNWHFKITPIYRLLSHMSIVSLSFSGSCLIHLVHADVDFFSLAKSMVQVDWVIINHFFVVSVLHFVKSAHVWHILRIGRMVRNLLHLHIISNHLHADILVTALDVGVSIIDGAVIFFAFGIFRKNVLSDLHQVVQSLLI